MSSGFQAIPCQQAQNVSLWCWCNFSHHLSEYKFWCPNYRSTACFGRWGFLVSQMPHKLSFKEWRTAAAISMMLQWLTVPGPMSKQVPRLLSSFLKFSSIFIIMDLISKAAWPVIFFHGGGSYPNLATISALSRQCIQPELICYRIKAGIKLLSPIVSFGLVCVKYLDVSTLILTYSSTVTQNCVPDEVYESWNTQPLIAGSDSSPDDGSEEALTDILGETD